MSKSNENKNVVVTQEFVDKLIDKIGKILKDQYALSEQDNEQQEYIELLLEKVGLIESNFEELTKSLAKGSYPVKLARSIRVTESLIPPKIQAIEISKSQLIQTYNEIVSLLSGYAIPVTLTPDSYRNLDRDSIILETTIKGNYWVVATLENRQHQYWLVPNSNLKFNIHQLKTIETLFTFKGNYNSQTTEFILQEPASLSLLPNNKHWKLLQPGVLLFGDSRDKKSTQPVTSQPNTTLKNTQQAELDRQILSNLVTLKTTVEQLNDKVLSLEINSEMSQKAYQRDREKWQAEKQALNKKLQDFFTVQSESNSSTESGEQSESFFLNNNISTELDEKDLATVKSLQSYFEKMPEIIRSYYSHHNASQEEAEILVNYCDRAAQMIKTVKNHGDLIKLYDYLIAFKGQLSKYNHRKHKYRWSVSCLENQVLTKLQQISILQNYQSDRLNYLLTQPDLAEKIFDKPQSNFIDKTPKQIQTDLKNKLSQFRKIYHQDKKLILDRLIAKVTVSIETLENITLNKFETIILENTPRGKYWIIDYSNDYYLIPSEEITVSYYKSINITNIAKTLFDFAGYYPEYSSSQLIRPALVSKVSSKQWKLEKKGKLIFS